MDKKSDKKESLTKKDEPLKTQTLIGKKRDHQSEMKQIFAMIDMDSSGSITVDEIVSVMRRVGIKVQEHEMQEMLEEFDEDRSGEVSFEEFSSCIGKAVEFNYSRTEVVQAFEMAGGIEYCGDGKLDLASLEKWLELYGASHTDKGQVKDLLTDLAVDDDGCFNFEHYVDSILPPEKSSITKKKEQEKSEEKGGSSRPSTSTSRPSKKNK